MYLLLALVLAAPARPRALAHRREQGDCRAAGLAATGGRVSAAAGGARGGGEADRRGGAGVRRARRLPFAACKRWWEKEWEALTIVGVVPAGQYDQFLHEKIPARSFPLVVRTRARNGARSEYFASVRFKKVEGDWYRGKDGKTKICPRSEAKIAHDAPGKPWKFLPGRDVNCEDVLDAAP